MSSVGATGVGVAGVAAVRSGERRAEALVADPERRKQVRGGTFVCLRRAPVRGA